MSETSGQELPLVLAGPILRRAERHRVLVWLATSRATAVRVEVVREDGTTVGAGGARSLEVGRRLFLHLAAAMAHDEPYPTRELLRYDIELDPGGRLEALGLLGAHGIAYPGLGLPAFVLQHEQDPVLDVLHGSCRLLHGEGEDAMASADELVAARAEDPALRPSALFLTGDQIYADDVAGALIAHVRRLATELVGPHDERSVPGCPALSELPVYGRSELAAERAALTGPKMDDHLLSFGEFAAMYLTAWNERLWPERLPDAAEALGSERPRRATSARRKFDRELRNLERARAALPAIRRLLANVPTYMMFDDHDVTNDWNLTREWRDRVRASPTGRRMIAGALAAYWAFQGWGNDPDAFDPELERVIADFACGRTSGAELDAALWGFDRWSYLAPTVPPTVVLDTRTQRDFDSPRGAARLIGKGEARRVAALAREAGDPLILVSAVPVFGVELQERRQKVLADHLGPYEIDFEAWHSNLQGFVDFMSLLAGELRPSWCLLLSGDVHYGCNALATFSAGERTLGVVQLVSSSFKHSGSVSRAALDLLGRAVSRHHERIGWERPPATDGGLARRVIAKAANTDSWNDDAPVLLAPRLARRLDIDEAPDYREARLYIPPAADRRSMLVGENNVGHVTLSAGEVTHRLIAGRRPHEARMPTGERIAAAVEA